MNGLSNTALQSFLQRHRPLPGLAAWGAHFPDRSLASHSYTDWFAPRQVEQILGRLAVAIENLAQSDLPPNRLCWTFEHARIHLALRSDGVFLALFVENRPYSATVAINGLLDDFNALPAT